MYVSLVELCRVLVVGLLLPAGEGGQETGQEIVSFLRSKNISDLWLCGCCSFLKEAGKLWKGYQCYQIFFFQVHYKNHKKSWNWLKSILGPTFRHICLIFCKASLRVAIFQKLLDNQNIFSGLCSFGFWLFLVGSPFILSSTSSFALWLLSVCLQAENFCKRLAGLFVFLCFSNLCRFSWPLFFRRGSIGVKQLVQECLRLLSVGLFSGSLSPGPRFSFCAFFIPPLLLDLINILKERNTCFKEKTYPLWMWYFLFRFTTLPLPHSKYINWKKGDIFFPKLKRGRHTHNLSLL